MSVFRVFDEVVGEEVALEILTHPDRLALERFKSEVRLARKVTHRNVGRTFDMGQTNGLGFVDVEWLALCPALEILREEPRFLNVLAEVGERAHKFGPCPRRPCHWPSLRVGAVSSSSYAPLTNLHILPEGRPRAHRPARPPPLACHWSPW